MSIRRFVSPALAEEPRMSTRTSILHANSQRCIPVKFCSFPKMSAYCAATFPIDIPRSFRTTSTYIHVSPQALTKNAGGWMVNTDQFALFFERRLHLSKIAVSNFARCVTFRVIPVRFSSFCHITGRCASVLVGGRNVAPDEVPRRQGGPDNRDVRLVKRSVSSVPCRRTNLSNHKHTHKRDSFQTRSRAIPRPECL